MEIQLSEYEGPDLIENIVLFISDSLRYDFLPEDVAELGVSCRAISPSTYTASSLPSIFTSQFPYEHKQWDFSKRLPKKPYLLRVSENGGINVDTVWGDDYENDEKPTLSLLNVDKSTRFDALEPPFTYIVHDHGGHSPYGGQGEGFTNTKEFFQENDFDQEKIIELYEKGVEESVERFFDLYEKLGKESLLENTLVIFTSDHGELLGEYGGVYEHTSPMVPETLEVPVVFCGAGIPNVTIDKEIISSIDLAPTALSALGKTVPGRMRGSDLWSGTDSERPLRADIWRTSRFGSKVRYAASSVWDNNGGVVIHRGSRIGRIAFAVGANMYLAPHASITRRRPVRNLRSLVSVYGPKQVEYGNYTGDYDPTRLLETSFEEKEGVDDVEVDREKLEALGYVQ